MANKYLRNYPTDWPIFSVKNYYQDNEGWWHWKPRNRKNQTIFKN